MMVDSIKDKFFEVEYEYRYPSDDTDGITWLFGGYLFADSLTDALEFARSHPELFGTYASEKISVKDVSLEEMSIMDLTRKYKVAEVCPKCNKEIETKYCPDCGEKPKTKFLYV